MAIQSTGQSTGLSRHVTRRASARRGSVLVEFALIAFALYMLVASIIEMGRAVLAAQVIQSAVDTMARELAIAPLGATLTFQEALGSPYVRTRIYDERHLVVDLSAHPPGPALDDHFARLPIVNQMLRPAMISDTVGGSPVLRYPGALVQRTAPFGGDTYTSVLVPRILSRDGDTGVETIDWLPVIEEIQPADSPTSHFGIDAELRPYRGMASVRINYPYQAATLSAYQGFGIGTIVTANDGGVTDSGVPAGTQLLGGSDQDSSPYAGTYGLGRHYALLGQSVRPFRKLLSAQAVRRRELFE